MDTIYSTTHIANYFVYRAKTEGKSLTPLKVQKLVYFTHGWFLAEHTSPLINELVQAWDSGPVFSSLYHRLKKYGNQPITQLEGDSIFKDSSTYDSIIPMISLSDTEAAETLDFAWKAYGDIDEANLAEHTRVQGTPWHQVVTEQKYSSGFLPKGKEIENDRIKRYFEDQIKILAAEKAAD